MKKQNSLSEKLKSYSLLTAGALASSIVANGQVVYTDVTPDSVLYTPSPELFENTYDSIGLDLNNDGITDLEIIGRTGSFKACSDCSTHVSSFFVSPMAGNSVAGTQALYYGNVIDSNLDWGNGGQLASHNSFYNDSSNGSGSGGDFYNTTDAYLGLRFDVSGEQHYGWVRLSLLDASQCIIHDYAYEVTADTPIAAGEIGCVTFYIDADDDNYGDPNDTGTVFCYNPGVGYSTNNTDCNDSNSFVHEPQIYYVDADSDGFGSALDSGTLLCGPSGYVTNNGDCDDANAAINLGAAEVCNNLDDNCNGSIDDGLTFTIYYADADGDMYGDANNSVSSCAPVSGYVTDSTDCDDNNVAINPAVTETCNNVDDNCNGSIDEGLLTTYYADADGDSYGDANNSVSSCGPVNGYVTNNTDCNDNNSAINPSATEVCNNIDDNCNGSIDDGLTFIKYYVDADGDGYGNINIHVLACSQPPGYVHDYHDCDDTNHNINPAAVEICNGIDDNCNNLADDGVLFTIYYPDADGDGYGDSFSSGTSLCSNPGAGYSTNKTDCNDGNSLINPAQTEICNNVDDNCNGSIDEGLFIAYYVDADGDSYGSSLDAGTSFCSDPGTGYSTNNNDCDDANAMVNPLATEICNNIDDNCNGSIDDGLAFTTYFADNDGDTYGDANNSVSSCASVNGYVTDNTDCDDNNAAINPAATEVCNNLDDDCNGSIDDGLVFTTYYADNDGDNFGDANNSVSSCAAVNGYVIDNTDCNDGNPVINPTATEICNNLDDNCNGSIDDGLVFTTYYADADGDTYGDPNNSQEACAPILNYVLDSTDCDDSNPNVNPVATEITNNNIDDDCDGYIDEFGVGVSAIDNSASTVFVFPNPTDGAFMIELTLSDEENGDAKIEVLNLLGQMIISEKTKVERGKLLKEIQLSDELAEGMYLVKVTINNSVYTSQINYQK